MNFPKNDVPQGGGVGVPYKEKKKKEKNAAFQERGLEKILKQMKSAFV